MLYRHIVRPLRPKEIRLASLLSCGPILIAKAHAGACNETSSEQPLIGSSQQFGFGICKRTYGKEHVPEPIPAQFRPYYLQ
jgi:hypothetical protein